MFAIDEGGTATQISPHNFTLFDPDADEPAPWDYHSVNAYLGIEIGVNLTKAIRLVEQLTGETLIHIRALPTRRDWAVDQANNVARAKAEYEAWERRSAKSEFPSEPPPFPVVKDPPKWIRTRLEQQGRLAPMTALRADVAAWSRQRPINPNPPGGTN
jgi:hypothetical protein